MRQKNAISWSRIQKKILGWGEGGSPLPRCNLAYKTNALNRVSLDSGAYNRLQFLQYSCTTSALNSELHDQLD